MATLGLGSLDNFARIGFDFGRLPNHMQDSLTRILSGEDGAGSLQRWRENAVRLDPSLDSVLNPANMTRLQNVPRAQEVYTQFHTALMDGMQNGVTASDTYAGRVTEMLGLTDESAAVVRADMRQVAEAFEADIAARMSDDDLSRADAIAAYRADWSARGEVNPEPTAETAARNTAQPDAAAATPRAAESSETGLSASDVRRIARNSYLRNSIGYAAAGVAGYYGIIYGSNALDGKPLESAIDGLESLLGRENAEQVFRFFESLQSSEAEFYQGGAEHIFVDNEYVNEEDLADPRVDHLLRAAALYATGGQISAGMHLFQTGTGSQFLDAYGDVERRMIEEAGPDGPEPDRLDIAREAFLQVRDQLREERELAARTGVELDTLVERDLAPVTQDTFMQGGAVAGTPAAVLAERRRREEGGVAAETEQSTGQTLIDQARSFASENGFTAENFSIASIESDHLSTVFDKVAEGNWLMKIGNFIAGMFGERAQAGFQRMALGMSDTQEVYTAFREAASEGRLVANDPGNDRFGVMSLLDFGPEPEPVG